MRIIGLALLACLGACSGKGTGNTAATAADTGAMGNTQASVAQASPTGLRENFIATCVAKAKASTPLKVDFTPICQCSADKLLAGKSPADLAKGIPPADARAVAMACAKEHPVKPSA